MTELYRNKEIRRYLLLLLSLAAAGTASCSRYDQRCAWIVLAVSLSMLVLSLWFTFWRYRRIASLSAALSSIAAGDYRTDLQDFSDGELSILQSELLKLTRTLSHQADELLKDKRYLAEALSDISHQLKTPLTSISMMTDLLMSPQLSEQKRWDFLNSIRVSTDRIAWLVAALLKISRLDAEAVLFKSERIAARDLFDKALAPLRIAMDLKNQQLVLEGTAGFFLHGDSDWLAEALSNLLKNCVEHTPEHGEITIRCAETALYRQVVISDNGPGIAAEDLPHVFERFYRGRNAGSDSVGIGLALSKSILQRQGGQIEARSEPGRGTRFILTFYGKDPSPPPSE